MNIGLEWKKMKRTGFFLAFLASGILASALPVLNMAVRSESYVNIPSTSVNILLGANWQSMAMLNILLAVAGACIMYHTEYADQAIQKMCTLPISEHTMFFAKFLIMTAMFLVVFTVEAIAILLCSQYWFEAYNDMYMELMKNFGFLFLLMLPAILLSLMIASACKNMWISLGIGIVLVFLATMLPIQNFAWTLFPYTLPYQIFSQQTTQAIGHYAIAVASELALIAIAEIIFLKVRRSFQ